MVDAVEPPQDAAWTQWKNLHNQTKDLSPWLTQDVRAQHLRPSKSREPSTTTPSCALTRIWTGIQRRPWKVLGVVVLICWFDPFSVERYNLGVLTCLALFKYMHPIGHPCLSTSKTAIAKASTGTCTSARNRNIQQLRKSRGYGLLPHEQTYHSR